jgi:hypothetical protein
MAHHDSCMKIDPSTPCKTCKDRNNILGVRHALCRAPHI